MQQSVKKFLEFNGKTIYFLAKNGQYWIAIKPLCEVLEINFSRQVRTLKSDEILGKVWSLQTIPTQGGMQKMICLSEQFIYGWLFSIRSESSELIQYKKECYQLLFDYFHGSITNRETLIKEKTKAEVAMDKLINSLRELPEFQELTKYEATIRKIKTRLRELDTEIQKDQLELFKN